MLTVQNWKSKLVYIGFGSFFGCLCTIIGMLASPVTAQRDKFDTIQCSKLKVVDANGELMALLGITEHGGVVSAYGKDGKSSVLLGITEHGGHVVAFGKDGKSGAWLGTDEHGGRVDAYGKDGKLGVVLSADEDGGRVNAFGKGEGKVAIGINEYGNGAVSTWDKNGYRQ